MRHHRNKKNGDLVGFLKDYSILIIVTVLILILFFNAFFSKETKNKEINNKTSSEKNLNEIKINLIGKNTKAYLTYKNGKKVEILDNITFSKGETINIEDGKVNIIFPFKAKLVLGKNGELSYTEDGKIKLNSGMLWVETMDDFNILMTYANIIVEKNSVANLTETMVEATIYNLKGLLTVATLAGIGTELQSGKKITIKAKDSKNEEYNISNSISDIDDYFKQLNWFKENGGELLLKEQKQKDINKENSGSLNNNNVQNINSLIVFDNIKDEQLLEKNKINLSGRFDPFKIGKITINNENINLDYDLGTFSFSNLVLNKKINDIIIKIYDKNNSLLKKEIITLYTKFPLINSNNLSNNKGKVLNTKIENYKVDASQFIIYEPTKTGKLTTTSSQVTIRGLVKNSNVKAVLVNGYKLKSFNGKTWRYHAFVNQGTLKDGVNLYEIKYLGENGKILYKEYYNIYKKIPRKKTFSGEVTLD